MPVKYEPWAITDKDKELWGIRILEGEFGGLSMSFNDIDMSDKTPDLALDYTVIQFPDGKEQKDIESPAFDDVLKGIVLDILEKAIEYNENRNSNSPEFGE
jgi:hypothetical protein